MILAGVTLMMKRTLIKLKYLVNYKFVSRARVQTIYILYHSKKNLSKTCHFIQLRQLFFTQIKQCFKT